ncbi:GntR family transcriptional regulator [Jeotgalibaca caeni]|uniref:GntR family transcriptional regulator n=1 Tax=Jeotgalibaca caeni TaxID=3028623 RepID=UPI00237E9D00|nr:GntR family transcriptional regulator [Jeotgalibaca caeni]MDE1549913.1 GntR family transcriptional regulator [Jeotgalibaca caeni]
MQKKYVMISNDIRNKILEGVYSANDQLPFEKDLCVLYDASKMTVKKALDILVTEGLIIKRRGSGTFVKDIGPEESKRLIMANQFRGTTASNPDKKITSEVLEFSVIKAPEEVCKQLNVEADCFVYDIYRLRYMDGEPFVIERIYMPIDVILSLKEKHIMESIYEYIEEDLSLSIQSAHRTVSIRKATEFETEKLKMNPGDPVGIAEQVGYLNTGITFEYSISVHHYNKFAVQLVLTRD